MTAISLKILNIQKYSTTTSKPHILELKHDVRSEGDFCKRHVSKQNKLLTAEANKLLTPAASNIACDVTISSFLNFSVAFTSPVLACSFSEKSTNM